MGKSTYIINKNLKIIIFLFFIINLIISKKKKNGKKIINDFQNYINLNLDMNLINSNKFFHKILNPKISVVISVFNGEPYIKSAVRSIQNQDFKSVEIIIVDDHSKDNSTRLIKQLMKEDPRIIFLQNNENRGALYTKTKGVLNAKGKYILMLDVDDLYTSRKAFSTLFKEAEKNRLEILGFSALISNRNITSKPLLIHHNWETDVIYQPKVGEMMYSFEKDGKPKRVGGVICCYLINRKLFVKSINKIGNEFLNKKIIRHDDFFCFFMLTRNAKNLKHIKKPFYMVLLRQEKNNYLINFHNKEKHILHKENRCSSFLYYIEFLLKKTKNTFLDKQIASYEFENWYLNNPCRFDNISKPQAKNISKLFLENKYINISIKNRINSLLNEFS